MLLALALLSGCSNHAQVEHQAFLLVMGLDRAEGGGIEMSAQIPRISGNSQESADGEGNSSGYAQMSVTGSNYEEALERLDWISPRDLNPAQLKLVVLSRDLAESEDCPELIERLARTERLFTATRVVVCEGRAKDFVSTIRPTVGTRLSTDISALFEHCIGRGFTPRSRLADLYYLQNSVYCDPMVGYAVIGPQMQSGGEQSDAAQPASALSAELMELSERFESDIPMRFIGAALFRDGRMCGVLDGAQTLCANLLQNEMDSFYYNFDDVSVELIPEGSIRLRVDADGDAVALRVRGRLSLAAEEMDIDEEALLDHLNADVKAAIRATQALGVDIFGFAEAAAKRFGTIEDWVNYDWRRRYPGAELDVRLELMTSNA